MNHPNKKCFKLEKISYKSSMFDKSVDATYIIHLENNGRLDSIKSQLSKYQPSNIVYIVYNKGFKNCHKKLTNQNSAYDLVDAFIYIFQDANEKKYNNILILEDDFNFSPEIYKDNHLYNINKFLIEKKDEKMYYFLGCIEFLQLPYNFYTNYNLLSGGTHCIIYSKSARESILNNKYIPKNDWDQYHNFIILIGITKYVYYKPLCYQSHTITENSQNWTKIPFTHYSVGELFNKCMKMDVNVEQGYSNSYYYSKILGYILIILNIIILITILYCFYIHNKNIKKLLKSNKIKIK